MPAMAAELTDHPWKVKQPVEMAGMHEIPRIFRYFDQFIDNLIAIGTIGFGGYIADNDSCGRSKTHPVGFEPTTEALRGTCSIHLSYGCC